MVEVLKNPAVSAETKCAMIADLTKDVDVDGSLSLVDVISLRASLALPLSRLNLRRCWLRAKKHWRSP